MLSACSSTNEPYIVEERNIFNDFEVLSDKICSPELYENDLTNQAVCKNISMRLLIDSETRELSERELQNFRLNMLNIIKYSELDLSKSKDSSI